MHINNKVIQVINTNEITIPMSEVNNNLNRYDALRKSNQYIEYVQDWLERLYHLSLDNSERKGPRETILL